MIPNADPIPLPAPVWLLTFLLLLTSVLHFLFMNVMVGGALIAGVSELYGRFRRSERHRRLAGHLAWTLPVAVAFTITFGVAPLLFLQVMYGQLFYTSSVLMAWPWLAVVGIIMAAYYGVYAYTLYGHRLGGVRPWVILASVGLFAVVGFLFVNNMTLMLQPERWVEMYQADRTGLNLNLSEATLLPRYLHFMVAAVAVSGAFVAAYGLFQKLQGAEEAYWRWAVRTGAGIAAGATLLQAIIGPWFLSRIPDAVSGDYTGGEALRTGLLAAGIGLAVVAVLALLAAGWLRWPVAAGGFGAVAMVGAVSVMTVVRHLIRDAYLQPHFTTSDLAVSSQVAVIALFFGVLAVGLGLVGWMVLQVLRPRPAAEEAAPSALPHPRT